MTVKHGTKFWCKNERMVVVRRAFKSTLENPKWTAELDTGEGTNPGTRADFSEEYIIKNLA